MTKTALITGASSGLGLELAQLFAADKHDVVLVARRREQLEALATRLAAERGVVAGVIAADLADPGAPQRIVDELKRRGTEIEFLVNNAGFGTTGSFVERDLLRELAMVQVNVSALVHLTGLLVPSMVARGSGRDAQPRLDRRVSAGAVHVGLLRDQGVRELVHRGAGVRAARHRRDGDGELPRRDRHRVRQIAGNDRSALFKLGAMSAPAVAAHAYKAMMSSKVVAIPGARNKFLLQGQRLPAAERGPRRRRAPQPGQRSPAHRPKDIGKLSGDPYPHLRS